MNRNNFPSINHTDLHDINNRRRNASLRSLWNNASSTNTSHRNNVAALYRSLLLQRLTTERHNFPSTMLSHPHGASHMNNPITMRQDSSLSSLIGNNNMNDAESAAAIQSMLLSSSNASAQPNSLPFLRQYEPMNQSSTTSAVLLQQQQQQQADLIARYQQQQQRLLNQQQQQIRHQQQLQMLEPTNNAANRFYGTGSQMGPPTTNFQEMMMLQQQQQSRGDDALFNSSINSNFASLTGYDGGAVASTGMARSHHQQLQQQRLQQQSDLLQHQLNNQQLQQQRLLLNEALFADPMEQFQQQQQLQLEQQLRRRSSMSSGAASISPLLGPSDQQQQLHQLSGVRPQLSIGTNVNNPNSSNNLNDNQVFGSGMAGTLSDFARFSNSAPMLQQQQSRLSSLSNHPQFNSNIGNRPTSLLSSSALLHPDEIAIIQNADIELARRDKKKRSRTFPEKLMAAMMEHEDERAVAWLPDGKSFVIVNPDVFVNEVLRGDFKQAKYASFVRKLHRWGFTRLTSGTGTDCFHHPQFNRNFPDWSSRITCVPMKEAAKDVPTIVGRTTSASATKSRATKHAPTMETDAASDAAAVDRGIMEKPPSLAGVERFIRSGTTMEGDKSLNFDTSSSTITKGNVANPYETSKHSDATAGSRLQLLPIETTTTRDNQQPEMEGEPSGPRATI